MRRLSFAFAIVLAACSFDPQGQSGPIDAADPDATPIDAPDAGPDACVPNPSGELCNGADDDCDGMIDEDFPTLGDACDGADTDLCLDDTVRCNAAGTGVECGADTPDNDLERCNNMDDDCDGQTDEDFPGLGGACDGGDADLCSEGTLLCSADGTGTACSDMTGDNTETCNNTDDDCDSMTDEGFSLGVTCDGADGDLCAEGVLACDGSGGVTCTDLTSTSVEVCDGVDNDCDGQNNEDFDLTSDAANCGACGNACTNAHGTTACATSACAPTCSAGAFDCDGNATNGCELFDTNPVCGTPTDLGFVNGDAASTPITRTGSGEAQFTIGVRETVSGAPGINLRAAVTLTSAPGTNYDLDVRCTSCGATASSSNSTTATDVVNTTKLDNVGTSDYTLLITVRWTSMTACGDWSLTVAGNTGTATLTCP